MMRQLLNPPARESWGPAFCLHVLQQKRDASFRWHDGENWEVISTDRPPL
jgi:hypothetical protein